ncbi:signal peptidase I [Kitasatospora sp. NPDC056327]|uniref:signal peptidase I n=1 Tax=Kitasatospora sp. NPDC056327 TaxID=3345785 RepID=UPI0035E36AD0
MSSAAQRTAGERPATARRRPAPGAVVQGALLALGLVLLVGGFAVIAVGYRPYSIPTASMSPTLRAGDTVLARRTDGADVRRGDVVVFRDQAWGGRLMVKRVVAIGGDTVAVGEGEQRLTVNGTAVDEPYLAVQGAQGAAFSVEVPPGRLFLLGDNRLGSLDSRVHLEADGGTVPATEVEARVEATALPLGRAGLLAGTPAFEVVGGGRATGPGPLEPAFLASVAGAATILVTASVGGVAGAVRRRRRRT